MIWIQRDSTDPFFNIAAEEYIFRNYEEEVVMLWINDPCIVVGKHQNTIAEINIDFVNKYKLPVIRRISGGGTVYHDPGNLKFTFIRKGKKGQLVDYAKHTGPIIDALKNLFVDAILEGKSNLTIGGLKFSGNAEHIFKERILHHGTLLFNSNLDLLEESIKVKHKDYQDQGVKSIRSAVTNIREHLQSPMSINEFRDFLLDYFLETFPDLDIRQLSKHEQSSIQELANQKYKTWDWNFAYSPKYKLHRELHLGNDTLVINLLVEQGMIRQISLQSKEGIYSFAEIENLLKDMPHQLESVKNRINNINFTDQMLGVDSKEFTEALF